MNNVEITAKKTVMGSKIPERYYIRDGERVVLIPDQTTKCHMREGHRVYFLVTVEDIQSDDSTMEEIYCSDPACSFHDYQPNPTEILDITVDDGELVRENSEGCWYAEKDGVYAGSAFLVMDYESEGKPIYELAEVELTIYDEELEMDTLVL